MRKILQRIDQQRCTFSGTFIRFGIKNGYCGPVETVLLQNIVDENGNAVADHLWFNLTKGFDALNMQPGDIVQFDGRVQRYTKGYCGRNWEKQIGHPVQDDYKLSRPTQIRRIRNETAKN
jgi:hypothetical protein